MPPRHSPQSEPTIRTRPASDPAIRAAGLARPRVPTQPELTNEELRKHEERRRASVIDRHESELSEQRDRMDAFHKMLEKNTEDTTDIKSMLAKNNEDTRAILMREAKGFLERNPKVGQAFVAFIVIALTVAGVALEKLVNK